VKSLDDVISYLHAEFDEHSDRYHEGLAATRRIAVGRIAEHLTTNGFPSTEVEKISLSLVPFIFRKQIMTTLTGVRKTRIWVIWRVFSKSICWFTLQAESVLTSTTTITRSIMRYP